MTALYRFISLPSFFNLITQKEERYVSPATWQDTYEGYMLRLVEKEDHIERVLKALMKVASPNCPEVAVKNYFKLWNARWLSYGQCWTTKDESDALWRIYSYDNMAIRIETDESRIKDLLSNEKYADQYSLQIKGISYDLDENGCLKSNEESISDILTTGNVLEPYYHKRKAFEHEHETRVLLLDKSRFSSLSYMLPQVVNSNVFYNSSSKNLSDLEIISESVDMIQTSLKKSLNIHFPDSISIEIPNLNSYIKSVMVHPQAKEWIVKLVEKTCTNEKLEFVGKSQMYEGVS